MAGLFGSDFNVDQPEDSSLVKLGAAWIRDLKGRLKRFVSVMFNPESGQFKDSVVRTEHLIGTGVTPGTYNRVTVNDRGLVQSGENEDVNTTAALYRARFEYAGGTVDTPAGVDDVTGAGGDYTGSGVPYEGTYASLNGSAYVQYDFVVPDGVRRLKAIVVGGGGGASASAPGFSVYSNAAKATTTTTGTWGWIAVAPGYTYPIETLPLFAQAFRTKTVAVDDAEKLSFDDNAGGSVAALLLPGMKITNQRTDEVVRIVSFDTGTTWVTERGQDASEKKAVLDNDQWTAEVRYGGAGGEHVEATILVTPGETVSVVVGHGGGEGEPGGASAVIAGAAHVEAGGGQAGLTTSGGAPVSGSKSSNVGYLASSGSSGSLFTGGRSGSNIKVSAQGWAGDGGGHTGVNGLDGMVILEWLAD